MTAPLPPLRRRLLLALLPVSTGGAVLVSFLFSQDSLLLPTAVLVLGTGLTSTVAARSLPGPARARLASRVRLGFLAGVAATAVYDLVRFVVVAVADLSVRPFSVFALFGQMLIGRNTPVVWQYVAGTAFHVVNGIGFAIGYAIVARRPSVPTALVWAIVLETFTIVLYPSWLRISALGEFFSMSMLGHVGYGIVLGLLLARWARGEDDTSPAPVRASLS